MGLWGFSRSMRHGMVGVWCPALKDEPLDRHAFTASSAMLKGGGGAILRGVWTPLLRFPFVYGNIQFQEHEVNSGVSSAGRASD